MSITNVTELETILTGKLRVMTEALEQTTKERDALAQIGAQMANVMFNLNQDTSYNEDRRAMYKSLQVKWDAAMKGKS